MHRDHLKSSLQLYRELCDEDELECVHQFLSFVEAHPQCFERTNSYGHVTGSAFVLSPDRTKVLMTFHKKLNKWLQLGGHADGESNVYQVALKECYEESGLQCVKWLGPSHLKLNAFPIPLDIDIHLIPKNSKENEHFHFDVRYLLIANSEAIAISEESLHLEWISLKDAHLYNQEKSIERPIAKILKMLNAF